MAIYIFFLREIHVLELLQNLFIDLNSIKEDGQDRVPFILAEQCFRVDIVYLKPVFDCMLDVN